MSLSPFKASKITGAGPISAGPSGYFAWGSVRSGVSERFVGNGFPPSGVRFSSGHGDWFLSHSHRGCCIIREACYIEKRNGLEPFPTYASLLGMDLEVTS